jgi:predicted nuclease of predicted toxin-antitoxin system
MKLLLDMNIPEVWEPFLCAAGHAAMHWSRVGDIRAQDTEIMRWARAHGQVVFTNDLDFGALLYLTDALAPSVVQVRAEHIVPRVMGAAVLDALEITAPLLDTGALVTIDPRRHRVRALPLRRRIDD